MNARDGGSSEKKEEVEVITLPDERVGGKTPPDSVNTSLFRDYLTRKDPPSSLNQRPASRHLRLGVPPQKHCSNRICTAKYNLITWAPKSLLYQFRRVANLYFLIISVLSFMSFSPKSPVSMAGTFAAVLVFTMLKEAYEDYFRHKQDTVANHMKTRRYDPTLKRYTQVTSAEVKVSDVLKVMENEQIPADMVLLTCSNPQGIAYLNTMNLDGETNLKDKSAPELTKKMQDSELISHHLEIECDLPDPSLIKWNCNMKAETGIWVPLGLGQLMLRGCVVKNTEWAVGAVIYTGNDTKIMLNSKKAPSKMSKILRKMNKMLYTVFAFQAIICMLFAGLYVNWSVSNADGHIYLDLPTTNEEKSYFVQILTFLVAYSHLIPISLYVALEVLKLALAYLISQDGEMYYAEDNRPASCRTSDLVEELGQVEFIFSDKTGTLTCNIMEFKECSINGVKYGGGNRAEGSYGVGADSEPARVVEVRAAGDADKEAVERFFTQLALCHSVFAAEDREQTGVFRYQAASPDELALVQGSCDMGYVFCSKEDSRMRLRIREKLEEIWEVLAEIPFDSTRKRMSLLLKEPNSGKFLLMCKGADSVLFPLLASSPKLAVTQEHLIDFAKAGLRTLIIAQKYVSERDAVEWLDGWRRIMLSNARNKEEMMDRHAEKIEKDLRLLGVSAIEDKLQKDVPETINLLMSADIRIWVLTGDKQETALEIAHMSKLIRENATLIDLSCDSLSEFTSKLSALSSHYVSFI